MSKYYICIDNDILFRKKENNTTLYWHENSWNEYYDSDYYQLGIDYGIEIPEHLALLWITYD